MECVGTILDLIIYQTHSDVNWLTEPDTAPFYIDKSTSNRKYYHALD